MNRHTKPISRIRPSAHPTDSLQGNPTNSVRQDLFGYPAENNNDTSPLVEKYDVNGDFSEFSEFVERKSNTHTALQVWLRGAVDIKFLIIVPFEFCDILRNGVSNTLSKIKNERLDFPKTSFGKFYFISKNAKSMRYLLGPSRISFLRTPLVQKFIDGERKLPARRLTASGSAAEERVANCIIWLAASQGVAIPIQRIVPCGDGPQDGGADIALLIRREDQNTHFLCQIKGAEKEDRISYLGDMENEANKFFVADGFDQGKYRAQKIRIQKYPSLGKFLDEKRKADDLAEVVLFCVSRNIRTPKNQKPWLEGKRFLPNSEISAAMPWFEVEIGTKNVPVGSNRSIKDGISGLMFDTNRMR